MLQTYSSAFQARIANNPENGGILVQISIIMTTL